MTVEELLELINQGNPKDVILKIRTIKDKDIFNQNAGKSQDEIPLFVALERGIFSIVKALIDAGADPSIQDNLGHTPLIKATIDDEKIKDLLLNHDHVSTDQEEKKENNEESSVMSDEEKKEKQEIVKLVYPDDKENQFMLWQLITSKDYKNVEQEQQISEEVIKSISGDNKELESVLREAINQNKKEEDPVIEEKKDENTENQKELNSSVKLALEFMEQQRKEQNPQNQSDDDVIEKDDNETLDVEEKQELIIEKEKFIDSDNDNESDEKLNHNKTDEKVIYIGDNLIESYFSRSPEQVLQDNLYDISDEF